MKKPIATTTRRPFINRLHSKNEDVPPLAEACLDQYDGRLWCWDESVGSGVGCRHPNDKWDKSPHAFDLVLARATRGSMALTDAGGIFHVDLYAALRPFLNKAIPLPVKTERKGPNRLPYVGLCVPGWAEIGLWRPFDPYRDSKCATCGRRFLQSTSSGWITTTDLGDRRALINQNSDLCVTDELCTELNLKEKFPDLRFEPIVVLPDPKLDRARFCHKQFTDIIRAVQRLAVARGDVPALARRRDFLQVLSRFLEDLERPLSHLRDTHNDDVLTRDQKRGLDKLLVYVKKASGDSVTFLPDESKRAAPAWNRVRSWANTLIEQHAWLSVPLFEEFGRGQA